MRIELSPWENVQLSSIPSRRRRKPGSTSRIPISDSEENEIAFSVAFSFVTTTTGIDVRPLKKARRTKELTPTRKATAATPFAVITNENWIGVVERHANSDRCSLSESQRMQFASRPGTSFLPTSTSLPAVPAVFDVLHDRFYALQKDNKILLSWESTSAPDTTSYTVSFEEPIISMSLLENKNLSIVYGTLRGNNFFMAYPKEGKILSRMLDIDLPDNLQHVGTFAVPGSTNLGRKKRVRFPEDENTVDDDRSNDGYVCFVQLFASKKELIILKHEASGVNSAELTGIKTDKNSLPIFDGKSFQSAKMIGQSADGLLVYVGLKRDGETSVIALSTSVGVLRRSIYTIPSESCEFSLVNDFLLMCTSNDLVVYDANRGATLERFPLSEMGYIDKTKPLIFEGCSKNNCLAFVSEKDEAMLTLSITTLNSSSRVRLADAIMFAQRTESLRPQSLPGCGEILTLRETKPDEYLYVRKALKMLHTAEAFVRSSKPVDIPSDFFIDAFWKVADRLYDERHSQRSFSDLENLCGVASKANVLQNGDNSVNGANGKALVLLRRNVDDPSKTKRNHGRCPLKELPTSFLNDVAFLAARIAVDADLSEEVRQNAHLMLRDVIRTRKVSARVFQRGGSNRSEFFINIISSIDLYNLKTGYCSVEFFLDLLRNCQDVSEGQMAKFLHFLLSVGSSNVFALFLVKCPRKLGIAENVVAASKSYISFSDRLEILSKNERMNMKVASYKVRAKVIFVVMEEIINYSDLNGALLRRGVMEYLSRKDLIIFACFLPKFVQAMWRSAKKTRRLLHITSVVCDCFHGYIPLSLDETAVLEDIKKVVEGELAFTQSLSHLQGLLEQLSSRTPLNGAIAQYTSQEDFGNELVSEYQIERLIL